MRHALCCRKAALNWITILKTRATAVRPAKSHSFPFFSTRNPACEIHSSLNPLKYSSIKQVYNPPQNHKSTCWSPGINRRQVFRQVHLYICAKSWVWLTFLTADLFYKQKKQHLFKIYLKNCNTVNVFTVTFDASLLNKCNFLIWEINMHLTDPKLLNGWV